MIAVLLENNLLGCMPLISFPSLARFSRIQLHLLAQNMNKPAYACCPCVAPSLRKPGAGGREVRHLLAGGLWLLAQSEPLENEP